MNQYIYALADPANGAVRYIGKSNNPYRRFKEHCKDSSTGSKQVWISSLEFVNLEPHLIILEECTECDVDERESWWINFGFMAEWPLTNTSVPGQSTKIEERIPSAPYVDIEHKRRKEKVRKAFNQGMGVDSIIRNIWGVSGKGRAYQEAKNELYDLMANAMIR